MPPNIDKVVAGKWLINNLIIEDNKGDSATEMQAAFGYSQRHDKRDTLLDDLGKLLDKYINHYGDPGFVDKLIEDSLASLKNESKKWRIEVLYWCRKAANADWEFESALGNISKIEMALLQRYHKGLGVSWEEVPQQL